MGAKLIYIPMFILFAVSIFGFMFEGSVASEFGTGYLQYMGDNPNVAGDDSGYYTQSGSGLHHVMYMNGTCVDDNGTIKTLQTAGSAGPWNHVLQWDNRTWTNVEFASVEGATGVSIPVVVSGGVYGVKDKDGNAVTSDGVVLPDANGDGIGEIVPVKGGLSIFWSGSGTLLGLMGIITGVIAIGAFAGVKFFGSGMGDFSAKVLTAGTALLSIYCFSAVYSVPYLLQIPIFGWVLVFVLSGFYAVGSLGFIIDNGGD